MIYRMERGSPVDHDSVHDAQSKPELETYLEPRSLISELNRMSSGCEIKRRHVPGWDALLTLGCVPLGWSISGSVIQDLSGSWCIKGTDESTLVMDSLVPLMHHDPDSSLVRITPKERSLRTGSWRSKRWANILPGASRRMFAQRLVLQEPVRRLKGTQLDNPRPTLNHAICSVHSPNVVET